MGKLTSITIDCADAAPLVRFWAEALEGYAASPDWPMVTNADTGLTLYFQQVPEAKTVKNRVHLDLSDSDREAEVARLLSLGASVFREMDKGGNRWTIMSDPEGNEFCVTQAK